MWRETEIVPVLKKGDPRNPTNYRPVALQSIFLKIFERCIYSRLYEVIEPTIPICQHGFRRKHFILTASSEVTEMILEGMEDSKVGYVLQLDIQKAYDTVDLQILFQKLIDTFDPDNSSLGLMVSLLT